MGDAVKKKILLVEDQVIIALANQFLLEKYGFDVVSVRSGRAAIETVLNNPEIDLILMDINLGDDMDGTEAAKIILEDHNIPLIFLSSHTEREVVEKTEGITSYGYIVKDSGETVLIASIKMAFKLFEANKKVALNEQRLSAIIANEPECVKVIGPAGDLLEMNTAGLAMLEANSLEEVKQKTLIQFVDPPYRKAFSDLHRDVIAGKKGKLEFTITGLNGTRRWLETHAIPLRNENDQIISLLSVTRDITETKRAFQLLTSINQINSVMVSDIPFHEIMKETCRILVEVGNFKMCWIGWINEETKQVEPIIIFGDTFDYVKNIKVYADERPEGQGPIGISIREGRPVVVQDAMNDPRLIFWRSQMEKSAWNSSIALPFGIENKIQAVLSVYSNELDFFGKQEVAMLESISANFQTVHHRKSVENLLLERDLFLNEIGNHIPGMFAYWTKELRCTFANEGYGEWFDVTSGQMKNIHIRNLLGEELFQKNEQYILGCLKGKDQEFECDLTKADGSFRNTLVRYIPQFKNNEVQGFFSMVTDITSVKKLVTEKEILLKEVHHRIKNNLSNIESILQLHLQTTQNEEAILAIQDASSRVKSSRVLYEKLLQSENYNNISIKGYIESLAQQVLFLFPNNERISLKYQIEDFQMDSKKIFPLGIIINEILTNAIKHAFTNEANPTVSITISQINKKVTMIIQDNGPGLPTGFEIEKSNRFGLLLVKMLTREMGGVLSMGNSNGATVKLEFNF